METILGVTTCDKCGEPMKSGTRHRYRRARHC